MRYEYCQVYYTQRVGFVAIVASKTEPIAEARFLLDLFNILGKDGWRLSQAVKITDNPNYDYENYYYYFERQLD